MFVICPSTSAFHWLYWLVKSVFHVLKSLLVFVVYVLNIWSMRVLALVTKSSNFLFKLFVVFVAYSLNHCCKVVFVSFLYCSNLFQSSFVKSSKCCSMCASNLAISAFTQFCKSLYALCKASILSCIFSSSSSILLRNAASLHSTS